MNYKELSFFKDVEVDVTKKYIIMTLYTAETSNFSISLLFILDDAKSLGRVSLSYRFNDKHFMVDVNKFFYTQQKLEEYFKIFGNNFSNLVTENFNFELMSSKELSVLFRDKKDQLPIAISIFNQYSDILFKRPNCLNLISVIYMNGITLPQEELDIILRYIGN